MVAPAFNLTVMKPLALGTSSMNNVTSISNAFTAQPGVKASWSATGHVVLDLGGDFPTWRQVFVGYTNAGGASAVRVRASANVDGITATPIDLLSGPGTPVYGNRPSGYRHHLFQAPSPLTLRYIRIDVTGAMDVGVIAAGPMIQPEFNSDYGDTTWGYDEAPEPELLDSGVEVLVERTPAPILEFRLSWLTEVEMKTDWEPLSRAAVEGTPVIVCRDPTQAATLGYGGYGHNTMYYGRLRLSPIVAADFDMYEVNGKIRSMV